MTTQARAGHWKLLANIALLAAVAVLIYLGTRLSERAGEPHWMTWHSPGGKTINATGRPLLLNCRGDARFQLLAQGAHAWTICPSGLYNTQRKSAYPTGALVRFSHIPQDANVVGLLPPAFAMHHTIGLLPTPKGRLAMVYRANTAEGPLVVSIAGKTGWDIPPTPLALDPGKPDQSNERGRLLGMAWQGETLHLAWSPGHVNDHQGLRAPVYLLHTQAKKPHLKMVTTLPLSTLCGGVDCQVYAAYQRKGQWRFVTNKNKEMGELTSAGKWTPQPSWTSMAFRFRKRISLTIAGILPTRPLSLQKRLTQTGKLVQLPVPPRFHMRLRRLGGQFFIKKGQLRLRHRWTYETPKATPIHDLKAREASGIKRAVHLLPAAKPTPRRLREGIVLLREDYKIPYLHKGKRRLRIIETRMRLQRLDAYEVTFSQPVARSPATQCLDPATTMIAPLPNGGYWLLHPSGCHFSLNKQWQRSDPLPLKATYERHTSRSPWHKRRIQQQGAALAWALFGLPLAAILATLLGPWLRRRQAKIEIDPDLPLPLKAYPRLLGLLVCGGYLLSIALLWPTLKWLL